MGAEVELPDIIHMILWKTEKKVTKIKWNDRFGPMS